MKDYLEELVELAQMEDELEDLSLMGYFMGTHIGNGQWTAANGEEEQSFWNEVGLDEGNGEDSNPDVALSGQEKQGNAWPVQTETEETSADRASGSAGDGQTEVVYGSLGQEMEQVSQTLRRSLVQAEQAVRYQGARGQSYDAAEHPMTARQTQGVTGSAGVEARQVDRIFERDARRYDNRFTLF